jgi:hypothetical protein
VGLLQPCVLLGKISLGFYNREHVELGGYGDVVVFGGGSDGQQSTSSGWGD